MSRCRESKDGDLSKGLRGRGGRLRDFLQNQTGRVCCQTPWCLRLALPWNFSPRGPNRYAIRQAPYLTVLFLAAISVVMSACGSKVGGPQPVELTTVEQIRGVTARSAEQIPVRLRGRITYADPGLKLAFMQDSTGGIRIETAPFGAEFLEDDRSVDLTGIVASGGTSPAVTLSSIHVLGTPLQVSSPIQAGIHELVSGRWQYREVRVEGIVRSAAFDHTGRLGLSLRDQDGDVKAWVRDVFGFDYHALVDSRVSVRGVLSTRMDARGNVVAVRLWVPSIAQIRILEPAPTFRNVPARTVASVLAGSARDVPVHRIRLHGLVSLNSGGYILKDPTGAIGLRVPSSESIATGRPIDLLGFISYQNWVPTIEQCSVYIGPQAAAQTEVPATLTTVAQVHWLSEDQARLSRPVLLQAVVTYGDPSTTNTFVQDDTGGIYLAFQPGTAPALRLGQLVQIEGFTGPGEFAPVVVKPRVRVLGERKLPEPSPIGMEQLFTGIADSKWVQAKGVVHSVGSEGGHATLIASWGVNHFKVHVLGVRQLPASLLDSEIQVEGVCATLFNFRRQLLGIQVLVPDSKFLHVLKQGAPYTPPLRSIGQLLRFSISESGRKSRIRGVVTLTHPSGPTYVSDSSGAVLVESHSNALLAIGDLVEVLGFAGPGPFNPVLRDAEIHQLGTLRTPEPAIVTADDVLEEGYDSELIRIDALLVEQINGEFDQKLVLETGDRLIEARIDGQPLPALEPGSLLRITGVVSIRGDETPHALQPSEFSVLLRSPADVIVQERASWWKPQSMLKALRLTALVALLAIIWIVLLRRRVRERTGRLAAFARTACHGARPNPTARVLERPE